MYAILCLILRRNWCYDNTVKKPGKAHKIRQKFASHCKRKRLKIDDKSTFCMPRQVERVQFMTANTLPQGDRWGQYDPPTTTVLLRMIRLKTQYVDNRYKVHTRYRFAKSLLHRNETDQAEPLFLCRLQCRNELLYTGTRANIHITREGLNYTEVCT